RISMNAFSTGSCLSRRSLPLHIYLPINSVAVGSTSVPTFTSATAHILLRPPSATKTCPTVPQVPHEKDPQRQASSIHAAPSLPNLTTHRPLISKPSIYLPLFHQSLPLPARLPATPHSTASPTIPISFSPL